jgi:serine/threonine-protein kinase
MVRLAHMETPPPDLLVLRNKAIPDTWPAAKKEHEMQLPPWLVDMVYKCLEKNPAARFKDGIVLNEYIVLNSTLAVKKTEHTAEQLVGLEDEKNRLIQEKESLQKKLISYQNAANEREAQYIALQRALAQKETELAAAQTNKPVYNQVQNRDKGVSKAAFFALLILTAGISAFAAYSLFFKNPKKEKDRISSGYQTRVDSSLSKNTAENIEVRNNDLQRDTPKAIMPQPKQREAVRDTTTYTENEQIQNEKKEEEPKKDTLPPLKEPEEERDLGQYRVVAAKAYFHNQPDESTRRRANINPWNNATLTALDEENGFIYIIYTNAQGQTSRGWLRKRDLKPVSD